MRFKFIKDIEINGVMHRAGEIHEVDSYDRVQADIISWCIGHGCYYPLVFGADIEKLEDSIKEQCELVRGHNLKTHPPYFADILSGKKTFDVRKNDRKFRVGEHLCLREYIPETDKYTGCECSCSITYVLEGGQFGIEEGYCVLGLKLLPDPNSVPLKGEVVAVDLVENRIKIKCEKTSTLWLGSKLIATVFNS